MLRIFILIWRVWFFILFLSITIIFFIPIYKMGGSNKNFKKWFWGAAGWGKFITYGLGFFPEIYDPLRVLEQKEPAVFVANHTSMLDIMICYCFLSSPFIFIGKKELEKIPFFGIIYKRTNILIDRSSSRSGGKAIIEAGKRLKNKINLMIFPEGGVPKDSSVLLNEFKEGAFAIAIKNQIPIVPITFLDNKRKFPYKTIFFGSPGKLRIVVHEKISTKDMNLKEHVFSLSNSVKNILMNSLQRDLKG